MECREALKIRFVGFVVYVITIINYYTDTNVLNYIITDVKFVFKMHILFVSLNILSQTR